MRADFARLAANCPARNGVRRIPLAESVEVHPIPGYGAVRMGALDTRVGRALAEVMSQLLTDSEVSQQLKGLPS